MGKRVGPIFSGNKNTWDPLLRKKKDAFKKPILRGLWSENTTEI